MNYLKNGKYQTYIVAFVIVLTNFITTLRNGFKYYCKNTSLHGFHYIYSESKFMVVLWAFMCICSGIFCYYLILLQLRRYNQNRISTTIATTAYPIWKVNFPAVTICNFNSVYKDNMKPITTLL